MTDVANLKSSDNGLIQLPTGPEETQKDEQVEKCGVINSSDHSAHYNRKNENCFSDVDVNGSYYQSPNEIISQSEEESALLRNEVTNTESVFIKEIVGGIGSSDNLTALLDHSPISTASLTPSHWNTSKVSLHLEHVAEHENNSCSINELDLREKSDLPISVEKEQNSGSPFSSICSLFQMLKPSSGSSYLENNESKEESQITTLHQNNFISEKLSCCPLGTTNDMQPEKHCSCKKVHIVSNRFGVINTSPKGSLVPHLKISNQSGSSNNNQEISDLQLRMSETPNLLNQPLVVGNNCGVFNNSSLENIDSSCSMDSRGCVVTQSILKPFSSSYSVVHTRLKLIHEGDISLCFLNHSKTILSKVLTSKLLRRWETHHIYLGDDSISSKTPSGILESPVSYSKIQEIVTVHGWGQNDLHCLKLILPEGTIIFQASNAFLRDQWISSIVWKKNMYKFKNILQISARPEVILREIKNLVEGTLASPLQDDCTVTVPKDIISNVLREESLWADRERREEVIIALAPLLEKTMPSEEFLHFFSQHCILYPRSPVIIDVFTSIVHRVLKRTFDFGKSPFMKKFAADYIIALYSQNNSKEAIKEFLLSVHGPNIVCPHPRVLQNLVAVNLAAIFSYFELKKNLSNNEENYSQTLERLEKNLQCHISIFQVISEFGDWRLGLAQLLQPIPFPDDALSNEAFIKEFMPTLKTIGTDDRCEVHETILGMGESKGGWLEVCCPSSPNCMDDGELWCQMLVTLISCCCRRKSFMQKMLKDIGALLLMALRAQDIAQEMLCLMLEWSLIKCEDQEMQIITTLESTESGKLKYSELIKRQEHLRELQKKRGPKKLTLPIRSTDVDVAKLLSTGSFGNLECLSLAFTHVTSSCANQLIQLPTLRYLNLWATHFGDAGLLIIAEHLDKLQVLNLCETPVTDKGISALASMKNLKKLNLNSTKLSPETLETLKKKLPALQELDVRYTDAW